MVKAKKIVLTGGPCGGKTQAIEFLKKELEKCGLNVYLVTESAETLLNNGLDRKDPYNFQKEIALIQIKSELAAENKVIDSYNSVVICDRGLMDAKVYLSNSDFERLKNDLSMNDVDMRDRYDAVFHMDSSAESSYFRNSDIRIENSTEAKSLNDKSLRAWCGNPHYRFIPFCDSFSEKLNFLLKEVCHFVGIPKPLEIEIKYLIRYPDIEDLLSRCCEKVEIRQFYLSGEFDKFRVRSRGVGDSLVYTLTVKKRINDMMYEEIETRINNIEFNNYINNNECVGVIKKDRYCLMYNGKYYEIDIFPFWKNQAYMEIELLREDEKVSIPEFIQIIDDVTSKPEYKNSALCKTIPKEII